MFTRLLQGGNSQVNLGAESGMKESALTVLGCVYPPGNRLDTDALQVWVRSGHVPGGVVACGALAGLGGLASRGCQGCS